MAQVWHDLLFAHWPVSVEDLGGRSAPVSIIPSGNSNRRRQRSTATTMAAAHGIVLPSMEPLLHFSRRQAVIVWPPARVH